MAIRVLHVDDDADFAALAAEFLARADDRLHVEAEPSAAAGLDRLDDEPFDCVVSDYQMPGTDGLEFLAAVRETHPDLPFVLFTGRGSEEVASEAISRGATDYVQKTGGTEGYELLANRVANAVDQHRSARRAADLEWLRTLAVDVNQRLVRAASRETIESGVCEIFSTAEPYRLAWIGSVDAETGRLVPRVAAGAGADRLDGETVPVGGALEAALEARAVAVGRDVEADPAFGPWRDADGPAFRAVGAVPLGFGDRDYGLLVVYAGRPDAFDDTEVELLAELGDDIAHAIDAFETRERLRDERDRRHALFENNPSPIVEFAYEDGVPLITAVNPAFEHAFEYAPDEIVGRPATETLIPEESFDEYVDIRRQLRDGEPVETDVTRQAATGPRDFLMRAFPYDVDADSPAGYVWYVDVSERAAREDRLAHQGSLLEAVMETSIDGILVIGEDREYVTWNRRFLDLWGVPEELDGEEPEEVGLELALDRLEDPEAFIEKVEYLHEHPDEESRDTTSLVDGRTFDRYSAPVVSDDGTYFGRVWFFRDVTDREAAVRELEGKNARLEEFASIVSHDLRNPINVAEGHLELAREGHDDEHLAPIGRALDRMGALVEDLLTLAREGSALSGTEPVALADLVESCWGSVRTAGAELRVETAATVRADEARLRQLVENLVRNAVEHGSTSPRTRSDDAVEHGSTSRRASPDDAVEHGGTDVTVTVGDLADGFYVEDTGVGVPAEIRDRVFESGFTTAEGGTGFGLAIVERIADAHGWSTAVTDGDDGGARVEVSGVEFVD